MRTDDGSMRAHARPPTRSAARWLALPLAVVVSGPLTGCARLPALAIAGRLRVVTEPHAAAESMAVIVGCGWKLERDVVARDHASEPPPRGAQSLEVKEVGCTDEALCAWQRRAELGAAQGVLPMAEEVAP
jgi:hypothetical protein